MKKVFMGLAVSLMLVMAMTAPATAAGESLVANVRVNVMLNFTIEDGGAPGFKFGSLHPGSSDNPELDQNGTGAVTLWLGAETNVDCNISTKADDFASGSDTIPIDNARWDTDDDASGARTMTRDYAGITTLSRGSSQDVWHWLSVPGDQEPGIYTTGFYYQAMGVTS